MPLWATLATALLLLLTLLPLSRHDAWWIRGLDFPRLQLAFLAVALVAAEAALLDWSRPTTWALTAAGLGCLVFQAWWIAPYLRVYRTEVKQAPRDAPGDRVRIVAANVLTPNRKAPELLRIIRENRPDLFLAVETDLWWERQLDVLQDEFPHALKRPQDNLYGMHLYSRLRLEDARIQTLVEPDIPSIHAVAVLPSGRRVRLHFVHPKPPSPTENPDSSERDAELVAVAKSVADAELPVIVAGDLNDVAWSPTTRLFRKISGLLDPRVGRGMFNTFHAKYPIFRWPLDHLFHSRHFTVSEMRRLPGFGSDHFPILVELVLGPEGENNEEGLRADAEDREWAADKAEEEGVAAADVHTPGE